MDRYYTESHKRFKLALRAFFDDVVLPEARENDAAGIFDNIFV